MPFYEYKCEACGKEFALMQPVSCKAEDTVCPFCKEKKVKKQMSKFTAPGGDHSSCGSGSFQGGG